MVWSRDLIENLRVISQSLKPMGAPHGDVEHGPIRCRQLDSKILLEGMRIPSQIYDHVENRSTRATDQLCFLVRTSLIVHTSESSSSGVERNAALGDMRIQTTGSELLLAKRAREKTAFIVMRLKLDEIGSFQFRFPKDHRIVPSNRRVKLPRLPALAAATEGPRQDAPMPGAS